MRVGNPIIILLSRLNETILNDLEDVLGVEKVAIVTDSTADIPDELINHYDIQVVNNIIVMEGQSLEDRKDINRFEFYRKLPGLKNIPTTSTASSGAYHTLYERLLQKGFTYVLSIHCSSKLSGIFNTASLAAQPFNRLVHVMDSENVSLGLGFQVLAAADALKQGKVLEQVKLILENIKQRVRVVAMLDTLEYVKRSGRVHWARAHIGELLRIKPFVEVRNGEVFSLGEARTYRKGMERLVEIIRSFGPVDRFAILHTNAEKEAQQLLDRINMPTLIKPLIVNATPVIGSHVGPNGLGFAAVLK